MTKRQIASLAIKLMGVFILLKSIAYIPMAYSGVFYAFQATGGANMLHALFVIMLSTGMAMIPLAFSFLVIIFSDKAAMKANSNDDKLAFCFLTSGSNSIFWATDRLIDNMKHPVT